MKFYIVRLTLICAAEKEEITFSEFNYFHGPVGAGKTTIAKLIDYCLGGDFEPTPVLQPIFTGVSLELAINERTLHLYRGRDSNTVRAQWEENGDPLDVNIPARKSGPVVVPGTDVCVLSDLFFHIAGITLPRVRKSKTNEDSELVRLSMRDLLWYCYLDQDSMDSSFFRLGEDANPFEKLKSLDVLRFIVGFHQVKVSELEAELANIRNERLKCQAATEAINEAFNEEQLSNATDLQKVIQGEATVLEQVRQELETVRAGMTEVKSHAIEKLQHDGRALSQELNEIEDAISELVKSIESDKSHRNTLRNLSLRQHRAMSARAELTGLGFENCPQCFQQLPAKPDGVCKVCGQIHLTDVTGPISEDNIDADAKARADELDERIKLQTKALTRLRHQLTELQFDKSQVDYDLNNARKNYDSAYLSSNLELERRQARLVQKIADLKNLQVLADKVKEFEARATALEAKETTIRGELRTERALAEKDRGNVVLLEQLFLDCLLRTKMPNISPSDKVEIKSPHFLPEVIGRDSGNLVTTTFANMSSGGKKNLFKCCFAVAVHRLAVKNNVLLPELLIIDSPMKNISERVNNDQFVGFNEMLYELAIDELKGTQFIILDKEFYPSPESNSLNLSIRHMTPNDPRHPPLLRNHIGAVPNQSE